MIQADGTELPLLDSATESGTGSQYANFILQNVQEARMEKHQIVETFGEAYIFFFGEAPRFLDVQAILVNSNDFNWEAEWWANYNDFFRGTKSVELGARTYLFYDDNIVEGYMLQAQAIKMADQPLMVQLSFRLFLTNYQNISFIGDPNFPIRSTVVLPEVVPSLSETLNSEQINALVGETTGFDANGFARGGFDLSSGAPLRSRFVDNFDEFTGPPPEGGPDPFDALRKQVEEDIEEAADLLQTLIDQLTAFGVDVNTPYFMLSLGLGPSFTPVQGFGVGAGASASATATFSATASVSASISLDASSSFASTSGLTDFEQQVLDEVIYQQLLESRAQLALSTNGGAFAMGSVGARATASASASASASAFAGASAGAKAGAGAFARAGAGASARASASASASASAFAGASASASAGVFAGPNSEFFGEEFILGGASFAGGASAGASVEVSGSSSAFAMASFDGELDETAQASAFASASVGADAEAEA